MDQIPHWASRYSYQDETLLLRQIGPAARMQRHLTRDQLLTISSWKTPRQRPRVANNRDDYVKEVTSVSFDTTHERLRIGVLCLLQGVSWPTASVILHFCSPDPYPILDYRALWSLGYAKPPTYAFAFWWRYVTFVRDLITTTGLSVREIDRALWQYSKERQK